MAIAHRDLSVVDGIHVAHSFTFDNEENRLAATLIGKDLHKIALQLDTKTLWILVSVNPVEWVKIGAGDASEITLSPPAEMVSTTVSEAIDELYTKINGHNHDDVYAPLGMSDEVIQSHLLDMNNPHGVTAEQAGALPISHPAGTISGFAGSGIEMTVAHSDHEHEHFYDMANPHGVTAEQVEALSIWHPVSVISGFGGSGIEMTAAHSDHEHEHFYDWANPHGVTAEQVEALSMWHPAAAISGFAGSGLAMTVAHSDHEHNEIYEPKNENIQAHINSSLNPHGVTAEQVSAIPTAEKNAVNGVAPLDGNLKVPLANMNDALLGNVSWQGTWKASDNTTPVLSAATPENKGNYYVCIDSGTQFGITFVTGDWVISNGVAWEKVDNTDAVTMVAGRTGNVVLSSSDITDFSSAVSAAAPVPAYATVNPAMNGAAAAGSANTVSRGDHVHPIDTSREPAITKKTAFNVDFETTATNIKMNGTQSLGSLTTVAKADHVHPADTSRAAVNATMYIGTTAVALNRTSGALALSGITSIDGNASTATTANKIRTSAPASPTAGDIWIV